MPRQMTRKKTPASATYKDKPVHMTATKRTRLVHELNEFDEDDVLAFLTQLGVGDRYMTCYMCGSVKKSRDFYKSTDPNIATGLTRICKDCCEKIVYKRTDYDPVGTSPTKQTIQTALEYLDKPFIDNMYDSAVAEMETLAERGINRNQWVNYISHITANKRFATMRWRDSDGLSRSYMALESGLPERTFEVKQSVDQLQENQERYEINKADVIRFVGYDCFADEPDADKPRLYAQLVGFLDDSAKEDPFKLNSIIQIVKALNQAEGLNTSIAHLMADPNSLLSNQAIVNKLLDSRSKCLTAAQQLAKDNGISQIYNSSKSQGSQTLSGRIKKVTEENLREGKVNFFSIGTSAGMQQVADITAQACNKLIGLNEDTAREINAISRDLVSNAIAQRDEYAEKYRVLLQESKDLHEYLRDKGLIDEHNAAISELDISSVGSNGGGDSS